MNPALNLDINDIITNYDFIATTPVFIGQLGGMENTENDYPGGLKVLRDFGGKVSIDSLGLKNPQTEVPTEFTIGRTMLAGSELILPDNGLTTQVVINAENQSGQWLGTVNVGSSVLGPIADSSDYTQYYTELSSELGGGAVGLAPFNFHQRTTAPPAGESRDCDPYQNEVVTLAYNPLSGSNEAKDSVTIAHYGSVYADGTGPHFRVEFRPDIAPFPSTPAWEDRTSLFEIDTTQSGTSNLTGQPTLVIKKTSSNKEGFRAAGRWRIRPIAGKVKCSDVSGNPDVEYQSSVVSGDLGSSAGTQYSWYAFRTMLQAPSGAMLLNTGNGPQPSDVSSWLTSPYEVNADGETNTQDLIDMVDEMNSN